MSITMITISTMAHEMLSTNSRRRRASLANHPEEQRNQHAERGELFASIDDHFVDVQLQTRGSRLVVMAEMTKV